MKLDAAPTVLVLVLNVASLPLAAFLSSSSVGYSLLLDPPHEAITSQIMYFFINFNVIISSVNVPTLKN